MTEKPNLGHTQTNELSLSKTTECDDGGLGGGQRWHPGQWEQRTKQKHSTLRNIVGENIVLKAQKRS